MTMSIFKKANCKKITSPFAFTLLFSFMFFACTKTKDLKPLNTTTSATSGGATVAKRPNIVLILGDDIGVDVPTCYGGQSYETPNIDLMAQQGMKFTSCHSSPLCSPSRVCIMTGKYNFRNYTVWGVMDPNDNTFANLLQNAGYATFVAGKWQL